MSNATTADNMSSKDTGKDASEALTTARLKSWLGRNTMVPLLLAAAAFIAIMAALLMWAGSPGYRVLFSNLAEADGGRIITELEARGVPYRFSEGGQGILVPADQVHLLRLQLAEQGLPQGGNVGFELMDNQAFGISQFSEQINFQRGLEGELARTIESLGPVSRARIHLALSKASVFIRDREPAKASVVVTLHPGRVLGEGQVSAIRYLVASAVPDLALDQVTVVDQGGRLLSRKDEAGGVDATRLEYIQEVERSYVDRIQNILTPLFGAPNLRVEVAAQIDFSMREETSERYSPNQPPNAAAVRSAQLSSSFSGGDELTGGVPGALSNTPPGLVPSPITPPVDGVDTDAQGEVSNQMRFDNLVNYEVDRNIIHVQHQRGQILRLSVAVVVNYRDGVDEEGNPVRLSLEDNELEQVSRLARQAMGFSADRGDELEVVNSPFNRIVEEVEEAPWWQDPTLLFLAVELGRYLMVGIISLLLYLRLIKPLLRRHLEASAHAAAIKSMNEARANASMDGVNANILDDGGLNAEQEQMETNIFARSKPRRTKPLPYESSLHGLRQMAKEDPRMVAMVVRNWLSRSTNG